MADDQPVAIVPEPCWLLLAMVEFVPSVACANGGLPQQAMAPSLAMILTMLESCAGILIVDNLVVPATQGIAEALRRRP